MKNILVPVGTSKNTVSHLQYAVDFAEAFGAKLYIVHIYKVFNKAGTMVNLDTILEREGKEYLNELISKIDTKNVDIVAKALKGKIVDTLELVSKIANIDLILIQPRTNSISDDVFLGETSGKIIKHMNGPASLIVPESYTFKPVNTILAAMKSAIIKKNHALDPLRFFKDKFNSKINVLLVKTPYHKDGDFDVSEELTHLAYEVSKTENATTFQGVLRHYESHNPDMLCVVRRKRGFFTKKWEKNVILKKDFSSDIPVLVLSGLK